MSEGRLAYVLGVLVGLLVAFGVPVLIALWGVGAIR